MDGKRVTLGASFSHRHLLWLGMDPVPALKEFAGLGLAWIRLGCYWDEIEKQKGQYDFGKIEKIISTAQSLGLKIVLTVGMKAPRYPEYYLPAWLQKRYRFHRMQTLGNQPEIREELFKFTQKAVKTFKSVSCLKVWQVENEPLEPAGPQWLRLDSNLLSEEVNLVKQLDPKKRVMINLWGGELTRRKLYLKAADLADIVGLDIYFKASLPFIWRLWRYTGPFDSDDKIKKVIEKIHTLGKEVWLAELQAEPWEPNEIWTKKENPRSCLPEQIVKNFKRVSDWNLDGILLWGFEYWYWRKARGDLRYWQTVKNLITG